MKFGKRSQRQYVRTGWVSLVGVVIMVCLVNCQTFEEEQMPGTIVACIDGDENNCVEPRQKFLGLRINSPSDVFIKPSQFVFNISGDCNEGGFTKNIITWELYNGGTLISSSKQMDRVFQCVMGRFLLFIEIPGSGTSLNVEESRVQHLLVVKMEGVGSGGRTVANESLARKTIYVNPSD